MSRFLGVGDHFGQTLVQERLPVLVHAEYLDRLFELAKVVDDFLKDVEFHDALKSAGFRDHVAMTGRAECAFEIAGAGRINEHDERRCQRNDRLQWRASDEIDSRFEPGFHGVSCDNITIIITPLPTGHWLTRINQTKVQQVSVRRRYRRQILLSTLLKVKKETG